MFTITPSVNKFRTGRLLVSPNTTNTDIIINLTPNQVNITTATINTDTTAVAQTASNIDTTNSTDVNLTDSNSTNLTTVSRDDGIETPNFILSSQCLLANSYLLPTLLRKIIGKYPIISYPLGDVVSFISSSVNNHDFMNSMEFGDRQGFCVVLSLRNPLAPQPSIFGRPLNSFQVSSMSGRCSVDESTYYNSVKKFKPNLVIFPAEELSTSTKHSEKICARSINEAHDVLKKISTYFDIESTKNKRHKSNATQSREKENPSNSSDHSMGSFGRLANLQGGASTDCRMKACELVLEFQKLHGSLLGVSIGGLGYEEELVARTTYLNASLSPLINNSSGNSLLRLLGLRDGNPLEILHAIAQGVDLVECTYPIQCASEGIALTFSVEMGQFESNSTDSLFSLNIKEWKPQHIKLYDNQYEQSFEKISENSPCEESRAYIHHLLVAKEMLAGVILTMHNIFTYVKLFEEIRNHINKGDFNQFVEWFLKTQQFP